MNEPIYDLVTLERVHKVYEFETMSDHEFDNWLHRQILRAMKQRELTQAEEAVFLEPSSPDAPQEKP